MSKTTLNGGFYANNFQKLSQQMLQWAH